MHQRQFLPPARLTQSLAALLFCAFIVLMAGNMAEAQSGRRTPKPTGYPTSTLPPAESEPTSRPPATKPEPPRLSLVVTTDKLGQSINIPLYLHDVLLNSFFEHLRDYPTVASTVGKDMNRKQAIDQAKAEKEGYVVWLELVADGFAADSSNPYGLQVNYVVYTPGTAKIKTQGRVYPRNYRPVLGGRMPPMRTSAEYQLYGAGRETAERVLAAFNIGVATRR